MKNLSQKNSKKGKYADMRAVIKKVATKALREAAKLAKNAKDQTLSNPKK